MARLNDRHEIGTPLGQGKCSKPMWDGYGMPAGFCDEPAYGPQNHKVPKAAPELACRRHGGPTLAEAITGRVVIRFGGPPGPEAGRFVEVERDGASISYGDWVQDGDYWLLVLPEPTP